MCDIDDIKYEYNQKLKEMSMPSNAFVSILKKTLEDHPDIIKDAAEEIKR